jgi:ABC-2 type transport system ATP-binding protein
MNAFELHNIEKHYPGFKLGPLSLAAEPGTVLALIGPNGAGKTTLMDLLAGVLRPARGQVALFGRAVDANAADAKNAIGYASEQQAFYENWTGAANLRFLAGFFPDWSQTRQQQLVDRFELPLDKKVKALSKGNRTKLSLVAALARQPRLLLLDEPTAGLDPLVRAELLDTLWELIETGEHTIFYSTHILSDVSRLADNLAFIRNGQLLFRSGRDELERDWRQLSLRMPTGTLPAAVTQTLISYRVQGELHQAVSSDFERTSDQLRALGVTQIEASLLSLEDISVHILRSSSAVSDHDPVVTRPLVSAA